jgi:hypothetical protein
MEEDVAREKMGEVGEVRSRARRSFLVGETASRVNLASFSRSPRSFLFFFFLFVFFLLLLLHPPLLLLLFFSVFCLVAAADCKTPSYRLHEDAALGVAVAVAGHITAHYVSRDAQNDKLKHPSGASTTSTAHQPNQRRRPHLHV